MKNELVAKAMTIKLDNTLPEYPCFFTAGRGVFST